MARSVEDLIVEWLGIVSGVRVPSSFPRTMAICSRSRTTTKPRRSRALTTFCFLERRQGISTSGSKLSFGNERFEDRRVSFKGIWTKGFDMETYRRSNVSEGFFISIALPHDNPFQAQRIRNITVMVPFYDYLKSVHNEILTQDNAREIRERSRNRFVNVSCVSRANVTRRIAHSELDRFGDGGVEYFERDVDVFLSQDERR